MNIRMFNDAGLQSAHGYLDALKLGETLSVPWALLEDDELSTDLRVPLGQFPETFETRFAMALWTYNVLEPIRDTEVIKSCGMWTWLTLRMLDIVAPQRADGSRRIGERTLYVLESENWQRYYRHLVAGPFQVLLAHETEMFITEAILAGKPHVPGELYEQIAARQEVITSNALVGLTRRLYWDREQKSVKRGAGGKGAGSARRLAALLSQLDLTWDFANMSDEAVLSLLPRREFAKFIQ